MGIAGRCGALEFRGLGRVETLRRKLVKRALGLMRRALGARSGMWNPIPAMILLVKFYFELKTK